MKVAIVGSGISGLAAAHALKGKVAVTLFESGNYFGGHTNTVDVTLPTPTGLVTHGVDTGFLVFNERTYPHFISLMAELKVATAKSDMSFSVQAADPTSPASHIEWSGTNLDSVFAQKRNLLNPRFWRMLRDLLRFNKLTTQLAAQGNDDELTMPLGDFLRAHDFSQEFCDWYFLPMMACIWSCPTEQMLQFPTSTMVRFCHNHGLLQVSNRPQWWTVAGGARNYVKQIVSGIEDKRLNSPVLKIETVAASDGQHSGVRVHTQTGSEWFDKVILATHSDQALKMLSTLSLEQQSVLSAIPYQRNTAVLHTDTSVLPKNTKAWAAWNYERATAKGREGQQVCLHYLLNKLQPLPWQQAVIVSLNPVRAIDPQKVLQTINYSHPVFDMRAVAAQTRMSQLQGQNNCYFAGAWMGYGFHEDGLKAGLSASVKLLSDAGLLGGKYLMQNTAHIGFGHVFHARARPQRHAFKYATYFLMLPMRSMFNAAHESRAWQNNRAGLLSFFDIDHGDHRDIAQGGALAWLDELLHHHGIHDATGEAWLQTYPRVMGYTFKPVSFWYCHRAENDQGGALRAIVAEVNNTFGEKHCYLLDAPSFGENHFANKVFHVSPFNPVTGQYRFRFDQINSAQGAQVSATVDYFEAADAKEITPTLCTNLQGNLQPITPQTLRTAFWRYPAMTWGVVLHIHSQALRLWLKKVPFFHKPSPPEVLVSR